MIEIGRGEADGGGNGRAVVLRRLIKVWVRKRSDALPVLKKR